MNIDELERLAREADEGYSGAHPRDSNNWRANEAFCRAASPDVMAKLIAVVRAAEGAVDALTVGLTHTLDRFCGTETSDSLEIRKLRDALRESLAAMAQQVPERAE